MGLDKTKKVYLSIVLSVAVLLLFFFNLCFGTVHIPMADVINSLTGRGASLESWDFIIRESRLPSAITALLAGASLAASGLMLQTAFRNPLAGPDILGINGGAGLGVALVMLLFGGNLTMGNLTLGASVSIILGALQVLWQLQLWCCFSLHCSKSGNAAYYGCYGELLASAIISLKLLLHCRGVHSYTMWGWAILGVYP